MIKKLLLVFALLFTSMYVLSAQDKKKEKKEKDPYAEYEYLWKTDETPRERRKRLKREKKEREAKLAAQRADSLLRLKSDTIKLDSLDQVQYTIVSDSLSQYQPPSDTIPKPADTARTEPVVPVDTVRDRPEEEFNVEDLYPEEEEEKKKERKPLAFEPIDDFRTSSMNPAASNSINGGFTYTQIGDEGFVGLTLSPNFQIWKIGLGLDIPVLFSIDDFTFRDEIYKDGIGVGRLIRYISYGRQKKDQVYVKVGQLDNLMIGYGGLVNNYTNSISFEKRKLGLHYDLNFKGLVGIEGMYSDFDPGSRNLLVTRPYVRPLSFTSIPVVRTFEFGVTFASDRDQTEIPTGENAFTTYDFTEGGISAFGLDAGITLLRIPFIQIDAFFNYSKLNLLDGGLNDTIQSTPVVFDSPAMENGYEEGSGISAGVNFRFNFIANLLSTDVRIERLSYTEHYIPQFFDANYELNKDGKILSTTAAGEMSGIYGSLQGQILEVVQLGGSLLLPDEISATSPAVVRLNADIDRLADKFSLHGSYVKGNLTDLSDAFTLDQRSIAKVRFIYHMNRFLAAGVDYFWAFTPVAGGGYEATRYISPYFGLSISF